MITLKYIVEMEIQEEIMDTVERNPAGLKVADIMQTRIESALLPLFKGGAIRVYDGEKGKRPIDLYEKCQTCGHPWVKHFEQTKTEQIGMSDGSIGTRGMLIDPVPTYCSECAEMVPKGSFSCREALKYVPK